MLLPRYILNNASFQRSEVKIGGGRKCQYCMLYYILFLILFLLRFCFPITACYRYTLYYVIVDVSSIVRNRSGIRRAPDRSCRNPSLPLTFRFAWSHPFSQKWDGKVRVSITIVSQSRRPTDLNMEYHENTSIPSVDAVLVSVAFHFSFICVRDKTLLFRRVVIASCKRELDKRVGVSSLFRYTRVFCAKIFFVYTFNVVAQFPTKIG